MDDSLLTVDSGDVTLGDSSHHEMSDKGNVYDSSQDVIENVCDSSQENVCDTSVDGNVYDTSQEGNIYDTSQESNVCDSSQDRHDSEANTSLDKVNTSDESSKLPDISVEEESDSLPLTESLALLAETKLLYSALQEKTNMLEEKYFSPEKMRSALSDPLGSIEIHSPSTPEQSRNTSTSSVPEQSRNTSTSSTPQANKLISRSIEYFEQLSQTSSPSENADVARGTPPKSSTKKLQKNRRPSQKNYSSFDSNEDVPVVFAGAGVKVSSVLPEETPQKRNVLKRQENKDLQQLTLMDSLANLVSMQQGDEPSSASLEKHYNNPLSQPSIETETTETSKNTATTESTARLRESVERLKSDIDDLVDCCNESFTTSLDTERHNLSDSFYDKQTPEDTITSDSDVTAISDADSNPVILEVFNPSLEQCFPDTANEDECCPDTASLDDCCPGTASLDDCCPDTVASELEELFHDLLLEGEQEDEQEEEEEEVLPRGTVGIDVTYHSDKSDTEDIHYVECEISDSPLSWDHPLIEADEIPDVNSVLILSNFRDPTSISVLIPTSGHEDLVSEHLFEDPQPICTEYVDDLSLNEESLSALSNKRISHSLPTSQKEETVDSPSTDHTSAECTLDEHSEDNIEDMPDLVFSQTPQTSTLPTFELRVGPRKKIDAGHVPGCENSPEHSTEHTIKTPEPVKEEANDLTNKGAERQNELSSDTPTDPSSISETDPFPEDTTSTTHFTSESDSTDDCDRQLQPSALSTTRYTSECDPTSDTTVTGTRATEHETESETDLPTDEHPSIAPTPDTSYGAAYDDVVSYPPPQSYFT